MDHSRNSNHHQQQLGVNKMGKNIRKSPLHQPAYYNHRPYPPPPTNHQPQQQQQQPPPQPQPQVYNISKNDFRSIVQQLTGTPSRDSTPGPPAVPQPRPSSSRLQKIRPPPLAPIARPPPPPPPHAARPQPHPHAHPPPPFPNPNINLNHSRAVFPRPDGPSWAESPVSAYMRYLESSLLSSDASRHPRPPPPLPSPGLLPSPRPPFPLPPPRGVPNSASLPLPTPPSAFPSPTAFLDLLSPRSPYPLLSPGFPYPPPLTPNFALSPLPQPGILGAGPSPGPQPLPSPGLWFPQSPSGFLPILSPRWRDML
ncbi:protein HAIKU1-like [Curcuma longa]|uniref:protein HAIKU1-like n=1 Tax=Curcuma longa TaxID=136217 RepID=UPI003D9E1E81